MQPLSFYSCSWGCKSANVDILTASRGSVAHNSFLHHLPLLFIFVWMKSVREEYFLSSAEWKTFLSVENA